MADSKLARRDGESDLSYHKRLIDGKLNDKTLADYDYSELSTYLYGKEYSTDVARRMAYGSKFTLDLIDKEKESYMKEDSLTILEEKLVELQKAKQEFFDQRREYNKLITVDARADHLCKIIADAANRLGDEIGLVFNRDACEYDHCLNDNEAVVVFSDWHYGMKASNIFNTYDTGICAYRVAKTVNEMISRIRLHGCKRLHVVILGDLIHGATHVTARVASDELVCEQIMHVSEILAQAINKLSGVVYETNVYMTYGNHARVVPNKKENIHSDNMERIIAWWLMERFKTDETVNVTPEDNNEFLLFNVCGHDFCATHGDIDGVKTSPRLLSTLFQKQYGRNIEYILLGDKHHRESFDELGITSMLCGSLCGTDDYANERRLYSTPSQMLLIVNNENGVDAEYRIKC